MAESGKVEEGAFNALHVPGDPLILYNVWDPGSARAVAAAGARAIATGSWSVAAAYGFPDGEEMPLDLVLANARRIVSAVEVPVTIDLVRGYGEAPSEIADTLRKLAETGAAGCNIEDSLADGSGLSDVSEQAERLRAAKAAAPSLFINARVDLFLRTGPESHDSSLLEESLVRAAAYVEAGADGIFVPALANETLIGRLCESCPKPVNILVYPGGPPAAAFAALGVARISHGPFPYRRAMALLEEAARAALNA